MRAAARFGKPGGPFGPEAPDGAEETMTMNDFDPNQAAINLAAQWIGTDPMTSREQVVRAVIATGEVPGEHVDATVDQLLPLLRRDGTLRTLRFGGGARVTWRYIDEDVRCTVAAGGDRGHSIVVELYGRVSPETTFVARPQDVRYGW